MLKMLRRNLTIGLLGAPFSASAQTSIERWPEFPVTIYQGFGPGGNGDILARLFATSLAASLGRAVVVEGKTGSGGNLASDIVAKSRNDGHSLIMLTGGHTAGAALYKRLPFDPVRDFSFIGSFVTFPFVFVTAANSPFQNLAQVIAEAKAKPGTLTYGTSGIGTTQHLTGELLSEAAGIELTHIPYRGGSAPLADVLAGRVDFYLDTVTTTGAGIRDGNLRAIGITSKERWPLLPDVATISSVVPGFEVSSWAGLAAPAGLADTIVSRLSGELHKSMEDEAVKARMATLGAIPKRDTPDGFRDFVSNQIATWSRVVERARIERQ